RLTEPGPGELRIAQPGSGKSGSSKSRVAEPGSSKSGFPESGLAQPGAIPLRVAKRRSVEPGFIEPRSQLAVAHPGLAAYGNAQPVQRAREEPTARDRPERNRGFAGSVRLTGAHAQAQQAPAPQAIANQRRAALCVWDPLTPAALCVWD